MNLILFDAEELNAPIATGDPRIRHLLSVLKRQRGEEFDMGIVNGPRCRGWIAGWTESGVTLAYRRVADAVTPKPVRLLVGKTRPQTVKRILRDCTSLGARAIDFFTSEKGEHGYSQSSLWRPGALRSYLVDGAQQAFVTTIPAVHLFASLPEALREEGLAEEPVSLLRVALDNYEAALSLPALLEQQRGGEVWGKEAKVRNQIGGAILAVGSERGWSDRERTQLRRAGFAVAHLGVRVQRTEVACLSALTLLLAAMGSFEEPTR